MGEKTFHGSIKTKEELSAVCELLKKSPGYQKVISKSKTMNEALRIFYGTNKKKMRTFNQWKKKGFRVKKGEKAYTFWSRPRISKKEEIVDDIETGEEKKVVHKQKFYGICKLFTKDQVVIK